MGHLPASAYHGGVLPLPAKLTQPRLSAVHARSRLFEVLDRASESSAVWMEAAPGSGKTTLAASWIDVRTRPCLWYQVDTGDADVATFFHYIGLAVEQASPRRKQPLPHLTPEYLASVDLFARRFFEDAFRQLADGTVVVFDNVQEGGTGTDLYDVLRIAIESAPAHVDILCLSRAAPPPPLARLRINGLLAVLAYDSVRLTLDEAHAIASLRGMDDAAKVTAIHERTLGWTAGLVLMLEGPLGSRSAPDVSQPETLFGYFASEVLARLDEPTRELLMCSAILPKMAARDVEALTGNESAGRFLDDLARRNYFTYRLSPQERVYEYHPLFREFLLTRLSQTFSPDRLRRLQSHAGRLLEPSGLIEDAAHLWVAAADYEALTRHIFKHAPRLVTEGRSHVIEAWLTALPQSQLAATPWLQYWAGVCRLAFDPTGARPYFERAFLLFQSAVDVAGTYESWASIIDTFVYEWSDFRPLDRWLDVFSALQASHPTIPSAAIDAHVASSIFNALMWRRPSHPDLPKWAEHVKRLTLESADVRFRIIAGNHLALYYLWMGEFASATVIVESLRPAMRETQADPLARMTWYVMEGMHAWFVADFHACITAVEAGSKLATDSGVHLHDLYLYAQAVYGGLSLDQMDVAAQYLQRMSNVKTTRRTDHSLLQYQMAAAAWCRGDFAVAAEHGETAARIAAATGAALLDGFCHTELAFFSYSAGRRDAAAEALTRGREAGRGLNHVQFLSWLYESWFALQEGRTDASVTGLRTAFALAAKHGYVNSPHWSPAMMARLCALALEHDVEIGYAQTLIRRRSLAPPAGLVVPESWPWPVQIYSLGRLRIKIKGSQLGSARKAPRKLLELLALLVASGETGVSVERAVEAIWPALGGTRSREALRVAIHRLRRLLDGDDCVLTVDGRVALNSARCWVDAWEFERLLSMDGHSDETFALYRGPFMDEDHSEVWALSFRERLHARYVRAVLDSGARLEKRGEFERALAVYGQGLERDGVVEAFYQCVITCCAHLGRRAEGLNAYARCRERLREALGVQPSQQTEDLRVALLAGIR
jgi:LuxR family transcriptional regulator, maltose regulon positive regulatory protein